MKIQRYCICGQKIKDQHELCTACENIYGRSHSAWPAWLRFMVSDMKREYRQDKRIDANEDCFTDVGLDQIV